MGVTYTTAAANTYAPIATNTLASTATNLTFSSIAGTYTDLVLIANFKSSATDGISVQFNGDTASNYSWTLLYGTGTAAGSARYTSQTGVTIGYTTASNFNTTICQFQNYSNATTYKTLLSKSSAADYEVDAIAGLWRSTAAITSIKINCTGTLQIGSTFTLYGIAAA